MKHIFCILALIATSISCSDNKQKCKEFHFSNNKIAYKYCYNQDTSSIERTDYYENGDINSKFIYQNKIAKMQLFEDNQVYAEGDCELYWNSNAGESEPSSTPKGKWLWFDKKGDPIIKGNDIKWKHGAGLLLNGWIEEYKDGIVVKKSFYRNDSLIQGEEINHIGK